jgi:hypothetical protein
MKNFAAAKTITCDARLELSALQEYQDQRRIPPLTGAVGAIMLAAQVFALASDDAEQLDFALERLAFIARGHAYQCFTAKRATARH